MNELRTTAIRRPQPNKLPSVAELDYEAFSPFGTAESLETFQARLQAFPAGFMSSAKVFKLVANGS